MTDGLTASDVAVLQGSGRNNGGFGDGDNAWWIVLFLIFGWGNRGWGGNSDNFGGGTTSVYEGYVLNNDFSQLSKQISDTYNMTDRKFEGLANGMCSMGYETQGLINGVNTNIMQGVNSLQGAVKDCCCQTQQNIKDTQYTIGSTGAGIQNQIQNCCCDVERQIERGFADTNYAMATQNCATLQAIDKVGDRIIDRLTQDKLDSLRDENAALRLSASQTAQNAYLVEKLNPNPCPQPAYVVQPPQTVSFPLGCNGTVAFNGGCGCN